ADGGGAGQVRLVAPGGAALRVVDRVGDRPLGCGGLDQAVVGVVEVRGGRDRDAVERLGDGVAGGIIGRVHARGGHAGQVRLVGPDDATLGVADGVDDLAIGCDRLRQAVAAVEDVRGEGVLHAGVG